jgi:hypothetical protein
MIEPRQGTSPPEVANICAEMSLPIVDAVRVVT